MFYLETQRKVRSLRNDKYKYNEGGDEGEVLEDYKLLSPKAL
tara:strand:+ start:188 stop:313 length:126 start_codon:yes stop_codon:yes gene_type:complete